MYIYNAVVMYICILYNKLLDIWHTM